MVSKEINQAADVIRSAECLLIGAGAGMGVDSGMPDFRGDAGFWTAYPQLYGKSFTQVANAQAFLDDPESAWGFYGHRLNLYRKTKPHEGFTILLRIARQMGAGGYFVYTSNVDGQFQKAGFSGMRIVECHGSIHHNQCTRCSGPLWPAQTVKVDSKLKAKNIPQCGRCLATARPNVLMFGDGSFDGRRSRTQSELYTAWHGARIRDRKKMAVIELGAGSAIPSVRRECELMSRNATLIRINPREPQGPGIGIQMNALDAMRAISKELLP